MRTVTFSSPRVNQALNKYFVSTFSNIEGDPTAGSSIRHSPREQAGGCIRGNGQQNVQTLFLTPDQEIFHVVTGYIDADGMLEELDFALRLFQEMQKSDDPQGIVSDVHRARLLDVGFSRDSIDNRSPLANFQGMMNGSGGSGSRGGSGARGQDPFQGFSKQGFLTDNKFCVHQPLLPVAEFESDPGALVGRGTSFFSSSSNNSSTGPQSSQDGTPFDMERFKQMMNR